MDDPDPALLCHRNRQPSVGNGVHRRADHRDIKVHIAREPRLRVDERRNYIRMRGQQKDVIEGERLRDGEMNHSTLTCFS